MAAEQRRIASRCYWQDSHLIVEVEGLKVSLDAPEGIKALKANQLSSEVTPGNSVYLFEQSDRRRMALIQERLSGLKD